MKSTPTNSTNAAAPKTTSAAAILGSLKRTPTRKPPADPVDCYVCQCKLSPHRLVALKGLGTPPLEWTCVKCSPSITTPRLGIFMGEVGTSELKIVDKIYSDSVRDMFSDGADTKEEED